MGLYTRIPLDGKFHSRKEKGAVEPVMRQTSQLNS